MMPRPAGLDRTLWPALLALVGVIALFEFTGLDPALQEHCDDSAAR